MSFRFLLFAPFASLGTTLLTVFVATAAQAKDIAVFDIRRPVSMENGKEVPKDYYLNAGRESGLKVNMVVTVHRRQTLYDPFQNKSPGDLTIPVGRLRIIHAQEGLSVARLEDMLSREKLPTLDIDAIAIGDRVDIKSAKMSPPKTASLEPVAPAMPIEILAVPVSEQVEASSLAPPPGLSVPAKGPTL